MASDFELLTAWRGGDDEAGTALVRRYFERVYLFFDGKVREGVDDLTQRTFLACMEARDRVREDGSFRAYLFGIARKQLLKHYDTAKRDARSQPIGERSIQQLSGSPSRIVADREEQRVLLQALYRIPLDLQLIVELFYWEEMSIAEIADVVEIPGGTVKSRLHRAKKLLREQVEAMKLEPDLERSTIQGLERWARSLGHAGDDER